MATISIRANTVRPSVDRRSDDTAFGAGTFSWQDPVHSWKAGPGLNSIMTVENLFFYSTSVVVIARSTWTFFCQLYYLLFNLVCLYQTAEQFVNTQHQSTVI